MADNAVGRRGASVHSCEVGWRKAGADASFEEALRERSRVRGAFERNIIAVCRWGNRLAGTGVRQRGVESGGVRCGVVEFQVVF